MVYINRGGEGYKRFAFILYKQIKCKMKYTVLCIVTFYIHFCVMLLCLLSLHQFVPTQRRESISKISKIVKTKISYSLVERNWHVLYKLKMFKKILNTNNIFKNAAQEFLVE